MIEAAVSIALLVAHATAFLSVLLAERRQPSATLAWLLALAFLPLLGLLAWFIIGRTRASKIARHDETIAARIRQLWKKCAVQTKLDGGKDPALEPRTQSLLRAYQTGANYPNCEGKANGGRCPRPAPR